MKRNPKNTSTKKSTAKKDFRFHPGLDLSLGDGWSKIEGSVLENIRIMISRIQKNSEFPKRLSIFSALSGEGVTTICLGTAGTLANDYRVKVCLVDLNWYSPSTLIPANADDMGIADVLENKVLLEQVIKPAGSSGLYVLPAGNLDDFKRPVMARSKALDELLKTLDGLFDHLILDIPAILTTSDSVHLASHGQGCCMVVQQGVTPLQDVKMALDEVNHLPILGVVINRVSFNTPDTLVRFLGG